MLDDLQRQYESAVDARINAAKKLDIAESAAGGPVGKYKEAFQRELKARAAYSAALQAAGQPGLPVLLLPKKSKNITR